MCFEMAEGRGGLFQEDICSFIQPAIIVRLSSVSTLRGYLGHQENVSLLECTLLVGEYRV